MTADNFDLIDESNLTINPWIWFIYESILI